VVFVSSCLYPKKEEQTVKGRYYIASVILLVVVLAVIAIYVHEKPENAALARESGKSSDKVGQLFGEMGIIPVSRAAGPFDIDLQDLDGRTVNLSEFKGKIMFLNFYTTWCQSCRDEVSSMNKLYDKLKDRDFAMVALDLEEQASVVKKFVKDFKLSFTVLLDSDARAKNLFGVGTIPTTFILDRKGRAIGSAAGPREWDSKKSIALFEYLISWDTAPAS
jgi:peroxiredoxin